MNQILNFIVLGFIGPQELIIIFISFLIPGICIIPAIFYLLTLQNTLHAISSENRKIQPAEVWLSLIPLFGLVWQFIIVNRMADSLKLEFEKKGITVADERPGNNIGMAYCILACCSIIPFVGVLTAIACLICWIMYWVKINNYRLILTQN